MMLPKQAKFLKFLDDRKDCSDIKRDEAEEVPLPSYKEHIYAPALCKSICDVNAVLINLHHYFSSM